MSLRILCAAALFAVPCESWAQARRRVKKFQPALPRPSKAVEPQPRPAQAEPARQAPSQPPSPSTEPFELPAAAGLALEPNRHGARVLASLAQSPAQALGVRAGDSLIILDGRRLDKQSDAAEAIAGVPQGGRESLLIERELSLEAATGPSPASSSARPRSASLLTPLEERLRLERLKATDATVPQRVSSMRAPPLRVAAGEKFWVRFPNGIPLDSKPGDVLEGLTSTALTTDARLDFLGIPPGSQVWAQVVLSAENSTTKLLRLHAYKIRLKGGHTYAISAVLSDISGDQTLARVGSGGTLVLSPEEEATRLAHPDRDFQISLLKPFEIYEASEFYSSGPGLWLRTVEDGKIRRFEVTHVIAKRSAETAGLKPGDRVLELDGTSADKIDFSEAVSRLYGPAGTSVKVKVLRADKGGYETLSLKRGVFYRKGSGIFPSRSDEGILAARVIPGSPAAAAGVKEGDVLIRVGDIDLAKQEDRRVSELLQGDLADANSLLVRTGDKQPRLLSIAADLYPTIIRPEALLSRAASRTSP